MVCVKTRATLSYPQHRFNPVDILNFVESAAFSDRWDALGLDVEDDMLSLQTCIMAKPEGDGVIEGSGGLRFHVHEFPAKSTIVAYYAYFPDHGLAYMAELDQSCTVVEFATRELESIRVAIEDVQGYLRRKRLLS